MAIALLWAGAGLLGSALVAHLTGRMNHRTFSAVSAIGAGLVSYSAVLREHSTGAVLNGAVAAMHAYWWWHGGGGDGTRRRLRQWRRRFVGVRRTAPQAT